MTCSPEPPEKLELSHPMPNLQMKVGPVEEVLEIKLSGTLHESRYHRSKGAVLAK